MAIRGTFFLDPYGRRSDERLLCTIGVISLAHKPHVHAWELVLANGRRFSGELEKTKSGHRNILHVLRAILTDELLSELGENYIAVMDDVPPPA